MGHAGRSEIKDKQSREITRWNGLRSSVTCAAVGSTAVRQRRQRRRVKRTELGEKKSVFRRPSSSQIER